VELLEESTAASATPETQTYMRRVVECAQRMHSLLDGILEFSRGAQGPMALAPCDSARALRIALENLEPLMRERGASVTSGPLPVLLADETQLTRVFQNLVSNGIKFNRSSPPRLRVEAEAGSGEWILSVSDNGLGIPSELRERAFEMFVRLQAPGDFPGDGVGLPICKRIVERHGGKIWIESGTHGGTVVKFSLVDAEARGASS
jgi:signal transduction histidine kinase